MDNRMDNFCPDFIHNSEFHYFRSAIQILVTAFVCRVNNYEVLDTRIDYHERKLKITTNHRTTNAPSNVNIPHEAKHKQSPQLQKPTIQTTGCAQKTRNKYISCSLSPANWINTN